MPKSYFLSDEDDQHRVLYAPIRTGKTLPPVLKKMINEVTEDKAYNAGVDCGLNGANVDNTSFIYFTKPEFTAAWERGEKEGKTRKTNK